MTNELEKQFFDTFGIEPKEKCAKPLLKTTSGFCKAYENCVGCDYNDLKYPQITDRILLELICLFAKEMNCFTNYWHTVEDLKKDVLEEFILDKNCFSKHQVQELFKEK